MDHFVQTNGITLHYLDHPGDAPTLVLLPGLTANAHAFDGIVQAGLSPRYRVVALDLRGRGLSDQPDGGYTMADHAADVLGLLHALGLERVVLGGHSFGGLLSMYLAAHCPERVTKLILIDAAAKLHPKTRELLQPTLARLGKPVSSWAAYIAAIRQAPYLHDWWDAAIEGYYRADVQTNPDGSVQARSRPATIAAAMEGALNEPWEKLVTRIAQPTILFNATGPYGALGAPALLPAANARATVAALANGLYVEVPGNHMTMLFGDGARHIVEHLSAFLNES